jgi:flavorubredoxin
MAHTEILDIAKDVKWIGIKDPKLRVFDIIMETKYGSTYNSYFIDAEKKTIIETAKEKFKDEYLAKVQEVVDPKEIEYIILDHTEPDHSGSLKHLLKIAPNATVVGSGNAIRYLADIVGHEFKHMKVKDGDELDLGNKTLKFIGAPNLHWPDSIYSYLVEDKILFTCDSFGAHYCEDNMMQEDVDQEKYDDAFKYYFDVILRPFSKFMLKGIEKIKDLDIEIIAVGHGPILKNNWKKYVELSREYAEEEIQLREPASCTVFIPYVSAYGYTKIIAESIAKGIEEVTKEKPCVMDIQDKGFHDLNAHITCSKGIIVGSPTINQNILPQVYQIFAAINPIRDKGKPFAAFGSYGWSGEGVGIIENAMETLKLKKVVEGLKIKFSPDTSDELLVKFGKEFGKIILEQN